MQIAQDLLDVVVGHALRDAPDECCGVIAVRDGVAVSVHQLENELQGPKRLGFAIGGLSLLKLIDEFEADGLELGAIYHSHTRSAPDPSQTDINFAAGWPGVEWLIVGTSTPEPEVKSFLISGGEVSEVPVEVT